MSSCLNALSTSKIFLSIGRGNEVCCVVEINRDNIPFKFKFYVIYTQIICYTWVVVLWNDL